VRQKVSDLAGYVATGVVSLGVGLLLRYLEPEVRLVWWSPHNFVFNLKDPPVVLQTNSITIQNLGRKSAEGDRNGVSRGIRYYFTRMPRPLRIGAAGGL